MSTGYGYDVTTSTLAEQTSRSISYVCCSSIANLYEVFDSYLKNILANVYINSDQKEAYKFKISYNSFQEVRDALWQVKSDKGFLKILRRISPHLKKHEKKNIWKINLINWYGMIDKVRHQIVHNRQLVTPEFTHQMKKTEEWKLFKANFELNGNGKSLLLNVSYGQTVVILNTFLEYAFLIFKSVSIDLNLPFEEYQKVFTQRQLENVYIK